MQTRYLRKLGIPVNPPDDQNSEFVMPHFIRFTSIRIERRFLYCSMRLKQYYFRIESVQKARTNLLVECLHGIPFSAETVPTNSSSFTFSVIRTRLILEIKNTLGNILNGETSKSNVFL